MSFLDTAKRVFTGRDDDYYDRDYDEEYDEYEDDYEEDKPRRGLLSFMSKNRNDDYDDYEEEAPVRSTARATSSYSPSSYSSSKASASRSYQSKPVVSYQKDLSGVEVSLITPASFDDSIKIVRDVKDGKITIFDVSEINDNSEARRIVDYICGAAEGMDCPFSRICPSIFCIAPKGVILTGKKQRY